LLPALLLSILVLVYVLGAYLLLLVFLTFTASSDLNAPSTTVVELSIFLIMGAGAFLVWDLLVAELSTSALTLLILGGACYLVGIVFFILGEYKPIYHVVWHLFVILAAALHWFCVYFFIVSVDITANDSFAKARVVDLVDNIQAAASATAQMMHHMQQ
jgi:channel protein (hemolysin III family)